MTDFETILREDSRFALTETQRDLMVRYRDLVLAENEVQNLTRLTSPEDFAYSHILDAVELVRRVELDYPVMDLGSGAGVPGIPAAILDGREWVLSDSELSKLQFLGRVATQLGLAPRVQAIAGRADAVLDRAKPAVKSVVSRAVGPVSRIYPWIQRCSTWNTLVLLKGPRWDEEWEAFRGSAFRKDLEILATHEYSAPDPREGTQKTRKLVVLRRPLARG